MMWERCAEQVVAMGGTVRMETAAAAVHVEDGAAVAVTVASGGTTERIEASHVISSMPLTALARIVDPPVPADVLGRRRRAPLPRLPDRGAGGARGTGLPRQLDLHPFA